MKVKKIKNGYELSFKNDEELERALPYLQRKVNLYNFANRTLPPPLYQWRQ